MIVSIIVAFIFCLIIVGLFIEAKNAPVIEDDYFKQLDSENVKQCIKKELVKRD